MVCLQLLAQIPRAQAHLAEEQAIIPCNVSVPQKPLNVEPCSDHPSASCPIMADCCQTGWRWMMQERAALRRERRAAQRVDRREQPRPALPLLERLPLLPQRGLPLEGTPRDHPLPPPPRQPPLPPTTHVRYNAQHRGAEEHLARARHAGVTHACCLFWAGDAYLHADALSYAASAEA